MLMLWGGWHEGCCGARRGGQMGWHVDHILQQRQEFVDEAGGPGLRGALLEFLEGELTPGDGGRELIDGGGAVVIGGTFVDGAVGDAAGGVCHALSIGLPAGRDLPVSGCNFEAVGT